jgi:IMP dehydrogenase
MNKNINLSYSFDDVLICPRYSTVSSRKDISLKTKLSNKITLNIPIISSPMDTVTEDSMAIAMALNGGLGIIHRFQSIESQVEMVKKVKRHLSYVIDNPYTIKQNESVSSLIELMNEKCVSGILVVNDLNKFVGIVSKKDIDVAMLVNSLDVFNNFKVSDIMTPERRVTYLMEYDYHDVLQIYKSFKIEKIPIIDAHMNIKGLVIFKNLMYFHNNKDIASLDKSGQLLVGAAVGVNDFQERGKALVEAGVNLLCIDVANGYNKMMYDAIQILKKEFPSVTIMAGNVCTAEGYEFLCKAGADCIRVGIGNGSICATRLQTGIGVCQFSALLECSKIAKKYDVAMISDGGHTGKVGNKFKALAAGSSCVLLGRSLAGTTESPGKIIYKNGKRFKYYRGMASAYANLSKQEKLGKKINTNFHVEGVEGEIEYKGSVSDQLKEICNGMRSGMSYLGVFTISELLDTNITFNTITSGGYNETITRV